MSYRSDPRTQQYGALELFTGCSRRELRTLARLSTRLEVPAGKVLARQGGQRRQLVVVISGCADVVRDGSVVDRLGAGDHHGEVTLLRGLPQPATLVATQDTVVDVFNPQEFLGAYRTMPSFRAAIDRDIDRRIVAWSTAPAITHATSSAAAA
jgi:CRP-like cAMP-binding protein